MQNNFGETKLEAQTVGLTVSAANVIAMRARIEALAQMREAWEATEYARSNDALYRVIQSCYALYQDLTGGVGDVAARKMGFNDYFNSLGSTTNPNAPLSARIIRCIFGNKDRRRLSTYHTVLRVVIASKWELDEVPAKIAECGGVQEMSVSKTGVVLSSKNKAERAKAALLGTTLATFASNNLASMSNPEKIGEKAVAVVTQNADGSYSVHCIVHSTSAVTAALSGYFGANKATLMAQQATQATANSVASQDELIAAAGAAANSASSLIAA